MAFLTINGIDVEVAAATPPTAGIEEVGERVRAFDGTLRVSRHALKQSFEFTTPPMLRADATALRRLLMGEGHAWSFDSNLYSSKGLGGSSVTNAVQQASGSSKFGAGRLQVGATTGTITFAAALGSTWSAGFWRSTNGTSWTHYLVRSDGAKWVDGSRSDGTSTTWLSVSSGSLTLANGTGSAVYYDDLYALPFLTADSWGPMLGVATSPFSALPALTVTGDLIEGSSLTCIGMAESYEVLPGVMGGSLQSNLRRLRGILSEV